VKGENDMTIPEIPFGTKPSFTILVADDDPDDRFLLEEALKEVEGVDGVQFVEDGEELIDYLHGHGQYADSNVFSPPSIIFLDLDMPKKDGRLALAEIKANPCLKKIPVIVWSNSKLEEDISVCHDAGADLYFTKLESHTERVKVVKGLVGKYSFTRIGLFHREIE
jgi:CheY-like chemotaxis protein